MIKICENKTATALTSAMIQKGREPHSVIICGEKGLGKKTLAKALAQQLLCERGDGTACGVCRQCRLIESGAHSDFITVEPMPSGNYKVDDIRAITADAYISPNEGRYKIYLIADIDRSVQTLRAIQNVMLKLIEEPPESAVIILTARSKEIFLDTIISRTICLQAEEVSPSNAQAWLIEGGADKKIAEEAVRRCGGNIGCCLEYIEDEEVRNLADTAAKAAAAAADRDELSLLAAFSSIDAKKEPFIRMLGFFQRIIRDSARLKAGARTAMPFSESLCRRLGDTAGIRRLEKIYDLSGEAISSAYANCGINTLIAVLTAEIIDNL